MKKIFKQIGITLITLLLVITSSVAKDLMVSADATPPRTDGAQTINANELEWEKVTTDLPLGGATNFNAFFFDYLKDFHESGGPMAARIFDNVNIVTFEEGTIPPVNQFDDIVIPRFNMSILALNSITKNTGATILYNGDAVIGDKVLESGFEFYNGKGGSTFRRQAKIDQYFRDAQADLLMQNDDLWTLESNKEVHAPEVWSDLTLEVDKGQNIFSLDASQVNGVNRKNTMNIVYDSSNLPEVIVIKVSSSVIRLGDLYVNGTVINAKHDEVLNRILWVFDPKVKNVEIKGTHINGSVFAPNADIKLTDAYSAVNGTIIANSLEAIGEAKSSEFHYVGRFTGKVKTPETPVEKTTSVSVNKKWIGEAKESVTVNLLGDDTPVDSIVLNAANEWNHTFTNLPLLDGTGKTIVYSVSEEKVLGYTSAISGTNNDFTITNTQDVIEKISIPVHKVWVGEGVDWHKPVTINLYLNDVFVQELILNEANQWTGSFDNLDKVEGYTIKEVSGDGFKSNITGNATDGFTVTNTRYEEKDITVNKVFIGDSKLDAINFDLLADKVVIQTITLNDLNNWTHTFEKLPVFNELGNRIEYSVVEHEVSGFNSEVTVNNSGFTITNTPTGTLDIPVSKVWVGKIGSEAIVVLSRSNSTETVEVSLNAANNWEHVFKDLPAFDANGIKITYSVSEKTIPGYGSDVSGSVENGFVFTNTFVPETHKIPVSKVWIGDALSEITVELILGEDVIQTLKLNATNNWTALFNEVPKTDIYGVDLEYSVREVLADGYKTVIQGNDDQGFIITNTLYEETSIAVTKKWLGESSVETITVKVLADGEVVASEDITATKDWKHTFEKLPVYNSKGQKISYTVEEVAVAGFETTITETTNGNFEITNKRTGVTSVDVSKVWVGKVGDSVIIDLYANDVLVDSITLNAKNKWAHSFKDLNAFDELGLSINYDVKERLDETYTSSKTGSQKDGFVFTNTYVIEKTNIPVTKTWVNVDDSTILPEAVYVDLYRDGVKTGQTLTLNETNLWQASFENLDKTDSMGIAYTYTVKEQSVAGFTPNVIDNKDGSFTIENRRQSITEVSVEKQWIGKVQDSVTINLLADGSIVETVVLNENNEWKHTFTNLEAFTAEGKAIKYTVSELPIDGYKTIFLGDVQSGFVIVNAYESAIRESINFEKVWVDGPVEHPEIEIQLLRNKVVIDTITLKNGDTSHSWTNLPKEDIHGKEYIYSVKEVNVPDGYESVGSGNVDEGFVITNTFKVALTDLTVTKTWINGPNVKPNIQVQLLRDGMAFGEVVTLNHPNVTYTWKDLAMSDETGIAYVYSVQELDVEGYISAVSGFEITNTFIVETTEFEVNKVWVGGPEARPEVKVQLFRDDLAFLAPVVLDETMSHKWTNLPKTDINGKVYKYTVDEVNVPSTYEKTVNGSVITNTYIVDKTDVTVNKTWVNGPDVKPSIQVQLLRDGVALGEVVTLNHPNLTHTWKDLDATDAKGNAYVYSVKELDVDGYESVVNGFEITNTFVVETTEFKVDKVWVGGPELRPEVQVQLFQDGVAFQAPVVLDETMTHTWTDLPKTDLKGKLHEYTVDEVNVPSDYVKTVNGSVITNTYIVDKTDITVNKTWVNGPDVKPSIQVQLLRDGVALGEVVTLNHPNLTHTWKDLDATDAKGNDYVYSVKELDVDGYESVVNGLEITNTFIVETTEFKVDKVWVGGPELRPEVQVQLFQDGVAFQAPVVLDETMTHTWTDLPKTDLKGKLHEYTVDEVNVPSDYVKTVNGSVITNTYIVDKTDITVNKTWVNGPDVKPSIQVQLLRDGVALGEVVTLNHPNLTHTWKDLDATDAKGNDYVYSVKELDVDGYESVVNGFEITNTFIVETTEFKVDKIWIGGPELRPEVKVQLFQNGEAFLAPVVLDETMTHTWTNLPKTDLKGDVYEYTVDEIDVPSGYEKSVNGSTIANTFIIEKTDLTVTKVWVNGPLERPDVKIQLLRDGEALGNPVTLTHPNTSYTWTDLDKTNLSGTDYVYTVVEVDVPDDYVSTVEGFTITNSYQVKTNDLAVNKVWVGPKTDAVEFSLFKDGELLETVVLNDANNWHYEFKDLAMTDLSGKEIVYTVVEEVLENYESDVVVNSDGSITITNTFIEIPEVPEVPEVPEKPKEEVPTLPATGIQSNLPIGMSMIAVGFVFVMRVLRRKESN